MGMFDEVKVAAPHNLAIDERLRDATFQTKDFDNLMSQYEINPEGRLIDHRFHLEKLPDEECEFYGTPEWESGGIYQLFGSMKTVVDPDVDTNYHGDFNFYTYIGDINKGEYEWFEYCARFTDGKLQWIKRLDIRN